MTAPRLTPAEQLRKAHMPSAQAAVLDVVKHAMNDAYGVAPRWTRNREPWEAVETIGISPNRFWSIILGAIDRVSARSNILESDTRELMQWARKRQWTKDRTLEELNVALGGRVGGMSKDFYGTD